jgi:hypothetical protein
MIKMMFSRKIGNTTIHITIYHLMLPKTPISPVLWGI